MMNVYCLNTISKTALEGVKSPDTVVNDIGDANAILVRSAVMHDMELPNNILAVARAGAGVNNIPLQAYAEKGIPVFNTPGANANAVKELVLCGLLLSSRDILGGNHWVDEHKNDENIAKTAEKAKSQFAGQEIYGKSIAVIGLGVIGVLVANACQALGMKVKGYDPYLTISNAMRLSKEVAYFEKIEDAVEGCDYVTIHVPLNDSTKGLMNQKLFDLLHDAVLLNFSRDSIVNEDDLTKAIASGHIRKYVTDFANPKVVNLKEAIILPHLGASTKEAEDNCAVMAIDELKDFIENGNITHSVNYPDVHLGPKEGWNRVCVLHRNIPGAITKITSTIVDFNSNIVSFTNKSRGEYAYSIFDVDGEVDQARIESLPGIIRVRVIK